MIKKKYQTIFTQSNRVGLSLGVEIPSVCPFVHLFVCPLPHLPHLPPAFTVAHMTKMKKIDPA